jgi:hypothetical protein
MAKEETEEKKPSPGIQPDDWPVYNDEILDAPLKGNMPVEPEK